jgi:uncharacterized membrane protein YebE (DUF533 family)
VDKAISWAKAHLSGDEARAAGELCLAAMIAGASGDHMDAAERDYVLETASRLPGLDGLPKDRLAAFVDRAIAAFARSDVRRGLHELAAGATPEQRRAAYALACLAALADGVATEDELDHLVEVRDGLGLTDGEAADVEATIREGVGAREAFEEDGVAWRLAAPDVRERAVGWASRAVDPEPLGPYADACIESMVLAAAADGSLDEREADHIHDMAERLPALGGIDGLELERFVKDAAGRIAREGAERRLKALAAWLPADARRGAFTLATVIALANHRATEEQMIFLERMRQEFAISSAEADEILETVRDEVYA